MIELNLIPDVKREFIRAQKMRAMVIIISVVASLAAVAVVILLALATFAAQGIADSLADNGIKDETTKLKNIPDLAKTLTVQNQVKEISKTHAGKSITSRIFNVLTATNPASPNDVRYSNVTIDSSAQTITIDAQTMGGYQALETYNKTLAATIFSFTNEDGGDERQSATLASDITFTNVGYGRDSQGQRVLSFTVTFSFAPELFMPSSKNARLGGEECTNGNEPGYDCTNVTDSYIGVPRTLFDTKATPEEEQ